LYIDGDDLDAYGRKIKQAGGKILLVHRRAELVR